MEDNDAGVVVVVVVAVDDDAAAAEEESSKGVEKYSVTRWHRRRAIPDMRDIRAGRSSMYNSSTGYLCTPTKMGSDGKPSTHTHGSTNTCETQK